MQPARRLKIFGRSTEIGDIGKGEIQRVMSHIGEQTISPAYRHRYCFVWPFELVMYSPGP